MRVSALVARRAGALIVVRLALDVASLRVLLADRVANGEAFPGEHVIRLPRRVMRAFRAEAGRAPLFGVAFPWWLMVRAIVDSIDGIDLSYGPPDARMLRNPFARVPGLGEW